MFHLICTSQQLLVPLFGFSMAIVVLGSCLGLPLPALVSTMQHLSAPRTSCLHFKPFQPRVVRPSRLRPTHLAAESGGSKKEKGSSSRTFAADFRNMTAEEINEEVMNCKKALFELRLAQATGREVKSHLFKVNKKKVAQLLTVRREMEIEQGINKRKSRKMERKRLLELGEMLL